MHDMTRGGQSRPSDIRVAIGKTPAINSQRSRATANGASSLFSDDAESRANSGISGQPQEETRDLRDEVLSTSMFEEIVGSSNAICGLTAQVMRVALAMPLY